MENKVDVSGLDKYLQESIQDIVDIISDQRDQITSPLILNIYSALVAEHLNKAEKKILAEEASIDNLIQEGIYDPEIGIVYPEYDERLEAREVL